MSYALVISRTLSTRTELARAFALVIASVISLFAISVSASASTFFVSTAAGASDSNAGSMAQPWRTIQHAVDTITAGDTIVVQPGTYAGCRIGNSGTAAAVCTLKAATPGAVLINSLSPANRHQSLIEVENFDETVHHWVIDGFECAGAQRYGIDLRDTDFVTVQNCIVHNSTVTGIFLAFGYHPLIQNNESYSNGEHGIYQSNSGDFPTIRGNKCHNNFSAGIHMNGDRNFTPGDGIISFALVEKNIIWENGAPPGGGSGINCDGVSDSVIRNNLLYSNHASGISLYAVDGAEGSSRNKVYNNTIVMAADGRWCINIGASTEGQPNAVGNDVKNNILYTPHTFRGSVSTYASAVAGFTCDYNVVVSRFSTDQGNTNMSLATWQALGYDQHSIIATPTQLFVDPAANNYLLKIGSPAIDIGLALGSNVPDDIRGIPRPQHFQYDIGCYELAAPTATPFVDFVGNPRSGPAPLTVEFADLSGGDTMTWLWDFGDGATSTLQYPVHTYKRDGLFTVKLTAWNLSGQAAKTQPGYIIVGSSGSNYFCSSVSVEIGKWLSGDEHSVQASDGSYLKVKSGRLDGKFTDVIDYSFETGLPTLSSLAVTIGARSAVTPVSQQVFALNTATGNWELLDDRSLTTGDITTTSIAATNPYRYVSSAGQVRLRVITGGVEGGKWKHFVDLVKITAAP